MRFSGIILTMILGLFAGTALAEEGPRADMAANVAVNSPARAAAGRKGSISTNVAGYANLLTLNAEGSISMGRHWTLTAGAKYNPFTFGKDHFRNKQQAYYGGMRYWPWHSYSGWWVAGKLQYQEFSAGGLRRAKTTEGDRVGLGLGAGFAYMVGKHFNVEFGANLWSGMEWFTTYSCPVCGDLEQSGRKFFILPCDIIIGVSYIF